MSTTKNCFFFNHHINNHQKLWFQRVDTIQAWPPFLLLSKEKDKRRLCSQRGSLETRLLGMRSLCWQFELQIQVKGRKPSFAKDRSQLETF